MGGTVDQEALIASVQERLDAMTTKMEGMQARLDQLDIMAEERILKIKVNRGLRQQFYNITSKAEIMDMVRDTVEMVIQRRFDTEATDHRIGQQITNHIERRLYGAIIDTVAEKIARRMMLVERPAKDGKPE